LAPEHETHLAQADYSRKTAKGQRTAGIGSHIELSFSGRGGIADDGRIGWDVFGNHCARAHYCSFADRYTAQNGRSATDTGCALDGRGDWLPIVVSLQFALGVGRAGNFVIDKRDAMADEDFVFDGHAFANKTVTGNFTVAADAGVLLNLNEGTDYGPVTDLTTVKVNKVMDNDVMAEPDIGRNHTKLSGHELSLEA